LGGLLNLIVPGVMARYTLVFPAVLVATLTGGPGAGGLAAVIGLAGGFLGRGAKMTPSELLSVGVAGVSLLLVLWLAIAYRHEVLARGRERERLIRKQFQLFERSHGFMFVLSGPEFRYEFANPTYLRLIGRQDVVGKPLRQVVPDLEPEHLQMLETVRGTGQPFVGRGRRRMLNIGGLQQVRYVDMVAQPVFAEDGSVGSLVVEGYDITEQVEAEERLKLVAKEVDHRANNLLAVVQSIATLSKGESPEELRSNILGRIGALARVHQLMSRTRWRGAHLRRLIEEELAPYTLGEPDRVRLKGPALNLNPAEAQALAMAVHELATNAAKYGALGTAGGRVEVSWTRAADGVRRLHWQEDGGPKVTAPPTRKGFGTRMLERSLAGVLGGRTQLIWRAEGLICDFELPPEPPGVQTEPGAADFDALQS
jgi:PAS domain S-box-containing protein